jgi:hypothetical protein
VIDFAMTLGLGAAAVYAVFAVGVIRSDRRSHGSWISFAGLPSRFMTLPVAVLTEAFGHRLDHRSSSQMAIGVGATASLIAFVVMLVARSLGA